MGYNRSFIINAIAFPISCTGDGENARAGSLLLYTVSGSKEISCSISGDAFEGTFGPNDTAGNYTATLTVTFAPQFAPEPDPEPEEE